MKAEWNIRVSGRIEVLTNHIRICEPYRNSERFREFSILNIDRMDCSQEVDIVSRRKEVYASIKER